MGSPLNARNWGISLMPSFRETEDQSICPTSAEVDIRGEVCLESRGDKAIIHVHSLSHGVNSDAGLGISGAPLIYIGLRRYIDGMT